MDQPAPSFVLQDTDGRKLSLQDFRGKVVILNFIYARCKEVCPLHSLRIAAVQQQLAEALLTDRVQFISIATDTEDAQQTVAMMRAHGPKYGLDTANWVFLHGDTGKEKAGLQLAETYGLKFTAMGEGEQMHGIVTHLIDTQGQLRARYHGLKFNPVNLTLHAAVLASGDHHEGGADKLQDGGRSTLPHSSLNTESLVREHGLSLFLGLLGVVLLLCAGIVWYRMRSAKRSTQPSGNA